MQLTIEKLVYGGDGLARLPADEHGRGKAVFVPFVLDGETVDVSLVEESRGFARGKLDQIVVASPQRVEARCPYFQRCGGCHYQHASYAHQLKIKAAILQENLRRIAKIELATKIQIHASPEWNYRNRSRFKLQTAPDFALGYYKFNSHELLPVEECPISSPLINRAIAACWQMGREGNVPEGIAEIEFFANGDDTQLLLEAYCVPELTKNRIEEWANALRKALPEIAGVVAFRSGAAEPHPIAVSGAKEITYRTESAAYRVSAGAFFQVNRHLTGELVKLVTVGATGRFALDLYAGVGLFSSALAKNFPQVISVESSQTAHADLIHNCPENVEAVHSTTERYLNDFGKKQPDLVVVDPPRSGRGESVVRNLIRLGAARIVYVSCDPATVSRDLAALLKAGYRIEQAHLVDLFPQTYHLESVFHLAH